MVKIPGGKTRNKILAGMGVATLGSIVLGAVAPQFVGTNVGKAIEGIGAYAIGGFESVIGAGAAMILGQGVRSFSGPSAMVNTETEAL
jgi:hypothetical protein|tara:strand:+ start:2629 stop:2892 length:264 start_codon:yes stop_codon:yes gene_type:complete